MSITRFTLEEKLLGAWHITSDLDTVIANIETMTEDELSNVLIGMKQLYDMKFDETFRCMETLISQGDLR